ncbi:hypothetical protein AB0J42_00985 [Nonomuraea sp. NPDC049649]|uniref:hypothetical protein n=1 Tax=Nonomuraea sp. NPDC049649 TaxID=3155776 RepID=UPI00343DC9D2
MVLERVVRIMFAAIFPEKISQSGQFAEFPLNRYQRPLDLISSAAAPEAAPGSAAGQMNDSNPETGCVPDKSEKIRTMP